MREHRARTPARAPPAERDGNACARFSSAIRRWKRSTTDTSRPSAPPQARTAVHRHEAQDTPDDRSHEANSRRYLTAALAATTRTDRPARSPRSSGAPPSCMPQPARGWRPQPHGVLLGRHHEIGAVSPNGRADPFEVARGIPVVIAETPARGRRRIPARAAPRRSAPGAQCRPPPRRERPAGADRVERLRAVRSAFVTRKTGMRSNAADTRATSSSDPGTSDAVR